MAHAIWSGTINFGLVTIPVKLYTAVREHELRFNFLHDKDHGRINNVRVCSVCGKTIEWNDVVRGYPVEKDRYVILSDDDFKRVDVEATQSVDICEFVRLEEIDPVYFDKPYYLEPEKKGRHAYVLLREALAKSGLVGVARVVIRTREHLAALKSNGRALVLELMHFPAEIVDQSDYQFPATEKIPAPEMKAASTLIASMTAHFKPDDFADRYRDELLAMIHARAKGGGKRTKTGTAAVAKSRGNVIDLMDVLKRSISETKRHRAGAPRSARRRRSAA
jgi:DNA end-binding protein Ku